ncbi:MAG: EamA-like transporter family protein [Firmicutes bacterium ADurb.Bin300]|nr:MAG: EamA-like transporter family protein [Firmicutes bacterium ADurb.Bin300]HOD01999.1 GRP family sugar transporter [Clostridiales bacterium]
MWFLYALLAALLWGGADLFYKKGSMKEDRFSDIKIVVAVGLAMGVHAVLYMLKNDLSVPLESMVKYIPVSFSYILSMFIGYKGLRYLELSVSSPLQNSSGAVTTILLYVFVSDLPGAPETAAIAVILIGMLMLSIFERNKNIKIKEGEEKYRYGAKAIMFPIAYCVIDGIGTFLDGLYLDEYRIISEDDALISFELTFLICGIIAFAYLLKKKQKFTFKTDYSKGTAALLETAGQYFYVFAMSGRAIIVAPLVSSYCVFSIIFSRLFLREKLQKRQYTAIAAVVAGILLLGICEGLAE